MATTVTAPTVLTTAPTLATAPIAPAAASNLDAGGMLNLLCALSNVTYCEEGSNIFEPANIFNETDCAEIDDDFCVIDRSGEFKNK